MHRGATLNTYFIVDGRSYTLRSLWERGILQPRERLIETDMGSVTRYEVTFLDRDRALQIAPETYEVLTGIRDNDAQATNDLSDEELLNVQRPVTPDTQEAKETFWYGVDTFPPHTDPVSIYDVDP